MIHYYINPKTQELIAFDDETREVAVMEPVGGVRQTEIKPAKPKSFATKPANVPQQRKQRLCSVCDKPGHTATTCPKNRPGTFSLEEKPKRGGGIDEDTITRIKAMYADGKSMKEIREATGISFPTIAKYTDFSARSSMPPGMRRND